ncbi:MAG: PrsW family intramembrane metalloprotease [Planctomycetes bacterium]|nr:PrsW family intramembrane metalloprotease [Planctomycetota bacterium]
MRISRFFFTFLLAMGGGLFAILGAFIKELQLTSGLSLFLIAPAIEEVIKPVGIYYLLNKKISFLYSKLHIVTLAMVSGLVFATLENGVYIFIYFPFIPNVTPGLIMFRLVVCTALHVICSGIVGIGLARQWEDLKSGKKEKFELENSLKYIIAAIAIHATYNTTMYFLEISNVKLY